MIFPGIKEGDILTLDDEVLEVCGVAGPDAYWLKNQDAEHYYHLRMQTTSDLKRAYEQGRLKYGKHIKVSGGASSHWHSWKRYTGATSVFDWCECGAKRDVDWRDLSDK